MIKRALISVWNKEGVIELSKFLQQNNIEILSTGGTKKVLQESGLKVKSVSEVTGNGSVMDGRVKTLDPKIFGGILADRNKPSHIKDLLSINGCEIDLVVVNFYPFVNEAVKKKLTLDKAIEFIDIGGPSMIRAAAKNFHSIVPLTDPSQYDNFKLLFKKNSGIIPLENRREYACRVFSMTAKYEIEIFKYFAKAEKNFDKSINISLHKYEDLRYGENPHQKASFYLPEGQTIQWKQLQGKKLSYNNYADIESAISIVKEFDKPACSIIKHANPCGFGLGKTIQKAYECALSTDPVSYFGGIVAFNRNIDKSLAIKLVEPFLECIIATGIDSEAVAIFSKKKNLRIIIIDDDYELSKISLKSVAGGFLVQEMDSDQNELLNLDVVTTSQPTEEHFKAINLGWTLVRYVKSNAIVFANSNQLLGVGAGQMSRVDSVKIGIRKVKEAGLNLAGSIIASDAFFPFPDSIELAAKQGVKVIVQPGGSIQDDAIIEKANSLGLIMVFTKTRHFYH